MPITIETDNDRALAALKRLGEGLADPSPVLREIGEILLESTKQRFATSTAPDGTRWAPNAEYTFLQYLGRDDTYRDKTTGELKSRSGTANKNFRKDGRLSARGAGRMACWVSQYPR